MQNDEHPERTFASEALSRLDPILPSAALLRRVASIPIEHPMHAERPLAVLFGRWPTRLLIFGSLALGAALGAIPLESVDVESGSPSAASQATQASSVEEAEFEEALSLALGTAWNQADVLPEEL